MSNAWFAFWLFTNSAAVLLGFVAGYLGMIWLAIRADQRAAHAGPH